MDHNAVTQKEIILFRGLSDFSVSGITLLSKVLKGQEVERDQYDKIARQLTSNKTLREIMSSSEDKRSVGMALNALLLILQEKTSVDPVNSDKGELQYNGPQSGDKPLGLDSQLGNAISALAKFGGFDLLTEIIDGVKNLDPQRKARRKIFLEESDKAGQRDELRNYLQQWVNIISGFNDVSEAIKHCEGKSTVADQLLKTNLSSAIAQIKELERSYRSIALFYKNAETDKIKNISIVNAELSQLKDLENTSIIEVIHEELIKNYDRLDLRNNYSLLIIPGYLGSSKAVAKWARIAYENKVMMITDFADLEHPDDVMELFDEANLTSGDSYRSNVMMTCNWLLGRRRYEELGEEEDLYLPPAPALGGKLYSERFLQVTAGKKHGGLNEVEGVKFNLKKSEIANLEKMGLIPMVAEYGKVMPFSARTLFNGDNIGLQTYSVVRVFDYITKVIIDLLNRRAFENLNAKTRMDIHKQIITFLDSMTGPGKPMDKFKVLRFEKDPNQRDRIYLDVQMVPYFPAKTFVIKFDVQRGDDPDSTDWKSAYDQI
jgi:hypothetical protein